MVVRYRLSTDAHSPLSSCLPSGTVCLLVCSVGFRCPGSGVQWALAERKRPTGVMAESKYLEKRAWQMSWKGCSTVGGGGQTRSRP